MTKPRLPASVLFVLALAVPFVGCGDDAVACRGACGEEGVPFGGGAVDATADSIVVAPPDTGESDALGRGQPCSGNGECDDGLTCNYGLKPPVCRPRSGQDGPCGVDADCEGGLACGAALRCKPRAAAGEACTRVPCAAGLVCNHATRIATCRPPGASGDPCADAAECEPGLRCNRASTPATCLLPARAGEPCWVEGDCEGGLLCNHRESPPACVERGGAALGEECGWHGDCRAGLACGADGKCHLQ